MVKIAKKQDDFYNHPGAFAPNPPPGLANAIQNLHGNSLYWSSTPVAFCIYESLVIPL